MQRNFSKIHVLIFLIFISLFLGGCDFIGSLKKPEVDQIPTPVQGEKVRNEGNGIYDLYDEDLIKSAGENKVVLFFSSELCAECNNLDNDILTNKDEIPQNVLIMKVDFEVRQDLKDKYKVDKENTIVEIDQSGEMIKKFDNKKTLRDLLNEL